jgi:hypothetical protein
MSFAATIVITGNAIAITRKIRIGTYSLGMANNIARDKAELSPGTLPPVAALGRE